MFLVWIIWVILFFLKATRSTKQKSSRFSIGHLQETSNLFNPSMDLIISTTVSSRIIQIKSVCSPVSCFPLNEEALKTDASNYSLGAVLSQVFDSGKHPIEFNSRKLIPEELNYEIHDKELLGIVWTLKRWRVFLLSLSSPFEVLTNHSSLQYFMSSKVLTHNQAHWAEFLSEFHFSITYHPGRLATLLDTSSYWVVVPNDATLELSILQKHHDSPLAGQPGQEKTLKLVKQDFHWSGMTKFIKYYVSSCQQCSRNKNIHHKKFGFCKPLPIPNGAWICLSMDFITQLPLSNYFDSILVIVHRFSKMAVFLPTMSSITSLDLAHLFIKNTFSMHGLPSRIVSDRYSLFVFSFCTNLFQQLKISRDLSTSYHPETDGKTERFFTVYGRDSQFYLAHITQDTPAEKLSTKVQSVQQDVKREIKVAINRFKRYADKIRVSPPVFNPGDMVWLSSKNIKSTRPTKKLFKRLLGPFPILRKVSTHAYHLKLPSQWKSIHPVFHISLLEPVKTSKIPNQHQEPPPTIIIE
ncbi:hypothetical protein O181_038695 [Austropuccinia psidii MF-1]|uniref:Integrase catalytic domain-containing protein n=1 Tax=Austropuccinia psidii MF-1 TaxID=1389203 RepID=A0A9Q3DDE0_9BASI|nr:hypothetical protein [Austropuccinia psidii MF-1]